MLIRRLIFSIIYLMLATYAVFILEASIIHLVLFPIIPLLFYLINSLHLRVPIVYEYIYLIFLFCSVGIGGMCGVYLIISWYDIMLHSLAGIILSYIPLYFIETYNITLPKYTKYIFIFIVSMGFGSVWEIYEYCIDMIFNTDMQKVEFGIEDTMQDLIAHASSSILFNLIYYLDGKYFKNILINTTRKIMLIYDK